MISSLDFSCKFNNQNGTRITLYKKTVLQLFNIILCAFQNIMINQFTGTWTDILTQSGLHEAIRQCY